MADVHGEAHAAAQMSAEKLLAMFDATDALRRPARFGEFVAACVCDHHGRLGFENTPYPQKDFLLAAVSNLQSLDFSSIAKANAHDIPGAISRAKLEQLQRFIKERKAA